MNSIVIGRLRKSERETEEWSCIYAVKFPTFDGYEVIAYDTKKNALLERDKYNSEMTNDFWRKFGEAVLIKYEIIN